MLSSERLFLGGWVSAPGPRWSSCFWEKRFSVLPPSPVPSASETHVQVEGVDARHPPGHVVVPPLGRQTRGRSLQEAGGPGRGGTVAGAAALCSAWAPGGARLLAVPQDTAMGTRRKGPGERAGAVEKALQLALVSNRVNL